MSGTHRAVALQAICVAVLAAAIYLAFLRPDDPSGLSGIKAENGPSTVQPPPDGNPGPKTPPSEPKPDKRSGKGDEGEDGNNQPTGNGQASGPAPGGSDADPGNEPTRSQYVNAVARVLGRVAGGGN